MTSEGKVNCGCIAALVVLVAVVAFIRYALLTPTGWGF